MIVQSEAFRDAIDEYIILFERSFGRTIKKDYFTWRFLEHPSSDLLMGLELGKGRIVASYSATPCNLEFQNKEIKTGLSISTMTDPDYRGKGLFPKLGSELYTMMVSQGYEMIWGFPNNNIHYGRIKHLQWNDIYEIPTMCLKVSDSCYSDMEPIQTDDDFVMSYKSNVSTENMVRVKKDSKYLQWRYLSHPINKYKNFVVADGEIVSSHCITKLFNDSLDIVDMQFQTIDEGEYLLRKVLSWANSQNLNYIQCWAPRHHFVHSLCEKIGFYNSTPITYFAYRWLMEPGNKITDFSNYSNWYIQMGDSDVY